MGRQARFQPRGAVGMDDPLGRCAIELGDGDAEFGFGLVEFAAIGGLTDLANLRSDFALDRSICRTALDFLTKPLASAGDIGHSKGSGFRVSGFSESPFIA